MDTIKNEPILFEPSITQGAPVFDFSYGPEQTECVLSCGGRSLRWEGEKVPGIIAIVRAIGPEALWTLWDEYGHLAVED